jgi:hypothetical protein
MEALAMGFAVREYIPKADEKADNSPKFRFHIKTM